VQLVTASGFVIYKKIAGVSWHIIFQNRYRVEEGVREILWSFFGMFQTVLKTCFRMDKM